MEMKFQRGFTNMNELTKEQLIAKNRELDSNNRLLVQQLKDEKKENKSLRQKLKEYEMKDSQVKQMTIGGV